MPWRQGHLACWAIVGMNHYRASGRLRLFVSMERFGRCIKAEGPDGPAIWESLELQALAATNERNLDAAHRLCDELR